MKGRPVLEPALKPASWPALKPDSKPALKSVRVAPGARLKEVEVVETGGLPKMLEEGVVASAPKAAAPAPKAAKAASGGESLFMFIP